MQNEIPEPHEKTFDPHSALNSTGFTTSNPAELIVYVQHTLGFLPSESTVFVSLEKARLSSILRTNLPPKESTAEEHYEYLKDAFDQYQLVDPEHSLIMIIFHGKDSHDRPTTFDELMWRAFDMTQPGTGFRMKGKDPMPIKYIFQATEEKLYSLVPFEQQEWDITTEVLKTLPLSVKLAVEGYCLTDNASEAIEKLQTSPWNQQHVLRAASNQRQKVQAKLFTDSEGELEFGLHVYTRLKCWADWISRIASTRDGQQTDKDASLIREFPTDAVDFVTDLSHVRMRDLVMLLGHFNYQTAVVASLQHYFPNPLIEELLNEFLNEPGDESQIPDEAWNISFLSRSLMGTTETTPLWNKNRALNALLRELLPLTGGHSRQAALGILAWLEWARGCSTFAGEYVAQALEEDPNYRFNVLFNSLLNVGRVSGWAGR